MHNLFADCAYFEPADKAAAMAFRAMLEGRAVILIIDAQKDYFDEDRLFARQASQDIRERFPAIGQRIADFSAGIDEHAATTIPKTWMIHLWNRQLRAIGEWGITSLYDELVAPVGPRDHVIGKKEFSPFYGTSLHDHLRGAGHDTIFIAGGVLEDCIAAALRMALREHGFNIVLMPDLTASRNLKNAQDIAAFFEGPEMAHWQDDAKNRAGVLQSSQVLALAARAQRILKRTHERRPANQRLTA